MTGNRRLTPMTILVGAGAFGLAVGTASVAVAPNERASLASVSREIAVAIGVKRAREPQPGDYWSGCHEARVAGTAPIYRGEPGYREGMDGDNDGVACEPHRR